MRLSRLICFYDDNGISIDGHVDGWFRDDTPRRFEAYGWNVIAAVDGHDAEAVDVAVRAAKAQAVRADGKPTLICCRTVIGKGSPNKAGTHDVHGAALGAKEVAATRAALGWTHAPFEIPGDVTAAWSARGRGAAAEAEWQRRFVAYRAAFPDLATEFERRMCGEPPKAYDESVRALHAKFAAAGDAIATRKASQNALSALAPMLPELFGGSADLTGSNLTNFEGCTLAGRDRWGNHLSYGVREFGMAAIMNGIALHGGYVPYGGTFLTFSDYSRNAIRMAALMRLRVIHVFTHDSIGLGEDGPTHQAVEHTPSLRLIPNLDVWRPADSLETLVAWSSAIGRKDGPIGADPVPPESSRRRARSRVVDRRLRGAAMCCPIDPALPLRLSPRVRKCRWPSTRNARWQAKACSSGWSRCPAHPCSTDSRKSTRTACCHRCCRRLPWKRLNRISGASTSVATERSWACRLSGNRRRPRTCTPTSALPRRT